MAVRRFRKERPVAPLRGFKLAYPMVSADGGRGGFSGVTLGRASVYGSVATAECAQGAQHRSPSRWCDCGFYCVHRLDEALDLACDPDYRDTVVLEVAASGRFMRYERGLRYARQRVTAVWAGRCRCGPPATFLAETGAGLSGWRRLRAVCAACAGQRPGLTLSEFARLLGGPPVRSGIPATSPAASPARADRAEPAETPGPLDGVDKAALVPVLSAEVALLQARLDEVQRQLARLTENQ
jgi:hypothetical protein